MNVIITKIGNFNIEDNGNNGSIITMANIKICEFPKVRWWDLDSLETAIDQHTNLIKQRIEERVNKSQKQEVSKENAVEIMEQLVKVLGNEQKGFYTSRLNQCINKLKNNK